MAMHGCFTQHRSTELEIQNQMQFDVLLRTPPFCAGGLFLSSGYSQHGAMRRGWVNSYLLATYESKYRYISNSGYWIYHLFVRSNLNFLHSTQWIIFHTQSCRVWYQTLRNKKSILNNCCCWLVGWLVVLFYGVSTLFGSFNAELSLDKSLKQFSLE